MNDFHPTTLVDDAPWWSDLAASLRNGADRSFDAGEARARVIRWFVARGVCDAWHAAAEALLFGPSNAWSAPRVATGVVAHLVADVRALRSDVRAWHAWFDAHPDRPSPQALAAPATEMVATLAALLSGPETDDAVVSWVQRVRSTHGGGPLGRHVAFRWTDAGLTGVERPRLESIEAMVGLERQWDRLRTNTEAFLRGDPAMHVLAYGPRGSGKSTLIRSLLTHFAEDGLRMVEVPAAQLVRLPDVVASLAGRPERFVVFVDDLAFDFGDAGYAPLKSLLDGSLAADDADVRLYATSNRRHLVQERLGDRPDPLDDDVHAWDTHHERLALSDRFGLTVTFPTYDRQAFMDVVARRLTAVGIATDDVDDWAARADRFARLGNGYSGRTATQFVDAVRAGLA